MAQQFLPRQLDRSDFDKGYLQLLGQLTNIGKVDRKAFNVAFDTMAAYPLQRTFVVEDVSKGKIIACITVFIEQKFARNCGRVGHIEDVVTDSNYRGKGLGKIIVDHAVHWSKQNGCYKVILDCAQKNVAFYEKCGFKTKELQMAYYFESKL